MGQVLGRYHIINELGRGGMGVVYKALDPKLERFIAIKCLSEELSEDEIVVARFLREARNVAALNHPNIAQIFVADEHEGKPYFVMEYVDGESLADFIDREGQCSPEMARRVTEQAATALSAAAEESIVHRDVKPGNIMIDRRGRAVLTDFGIACVTAGQSDGGRDKTVMGTPGYLAPEALTGGQPDLRSDMFALGAVYYEMLAGERLIDGKGLKEIYARIAQPGFPDLSDLEGKVDERVISIIRRMLALNPEDRYPDWQSLLSDMAPLKTGTTGPVKRPDSGPSTAETELTRAMTAAVQSDGDDAARTATRAMDDGGGDRPETAPVAQPPKSSRAKRYGLLGALALTLAMVALGVARMDGSQWDRITGLIPGGEDASETETVARSGESEDTASPESAETPATGGTESTSVAGTDTAPETATDREMAAVEPAGEATDEPVVDGESDEPAATARAGQATTGGGFQIDTVSAEDESEALAASQGETDAMTESPETAVETDSDASRPAGDEALAMVDTESRANTASVAERAPAQPAPPPRGVVVVGVGDPVISDPMVREIEAALRSTGRPLVERNFISGYRRYLSENDVDLAGLAEPALSAGARYVVIARALPAGERELQYYNRIETAYIAQLEAVTYDLHRNRQIGSSPVEQIEFTSLNATERARESVRPWLAGIRQQFD